MSLNVFFCEIAVLDSIRHRKQFYLEDPLSSPGGRRVLGPRGQKQPDASASALGLDCGVVACLISMGPLALKSRDPSDLLSNHYMHKALWGGVQINTSLPTGEALRVGRVCVWFSAWHVEAINNHLLMNGLCPLIVYSSAGRID